MLVSVRNEPVIIDRYAIIPLIEVGRVAKFMETEKRRGVPGWGVEGIPSRLMRAGFQFCKMKRFLEIGFTTL